MKSFGLKETIMWHAVRCGAHVAKKGLKKKAREPRARLVSLILGQESMRGRADRLKKRVMWFKEKTPQIRIYPELPHEFE